MANKENKKKKITKIHMNKKKSLGRILIYVSIVAIMFTLVQSTEATLLSNLKTNINFNTNANGTSTQGYYNYSCTTSLNTSHYKINASNSISGTSCTESSPTINRTNKFTLNLWFYSNSNGNCQNGAGGYCRIIAQNPGTFDILLTRVAATSSLYIYLSKLGDSTWRNTTIKLTLNEWIMLTFVYNGSEMRVYNNSQLTYTKTGLNGATLTNDPVIISGNTEHAQGLIDEYGQWDRDLTDTEITTLYNSGSGLAYPFGISESAISFQGQTPSDGTEQHYTSPTFSINTTTTGLGGTTTTSHYIYNSVGTLIYQYNGSANFTSNYSIATTDTYYFNATSTNTTNTTSTATRTIIIYNGVEGAFTNPTTGQKITSTINLTWLASNTTPPTTKTPTNYTIRLQNLSGAIWNITSNTTTTSYYWNTGLREIMPGTYYLYKETAYNDGKTSNNTNGTEINLTITDYIEINVYSEDGTPITNPRTIITNTSETSLTNPGTFTTTTYYPQNTTTYNKTYQVNASDLDLFHSDTITNITINRATTSFNVTLYKVYFRANFTRYGTLYNTSGVMTDSLPKTARFANTSIVVSQEDLALGKVIMYFGNNVTGNWTQYYEYINDKSQITEQLEVLDNPDWYFYFRALTLSKSPLEEATIRLTCSNTTTNYPSWDYQSLVGQRLTESDGYTFFWMKYGKTCHFIAYKEGYDNVSGSFIVGDEDRSWESPLIIYFQPEAQSITDNYVIAWIPTSTYDKTTGIPISIFTPSITNVKINNTHRNSLGLSAKTLECNEQVCNTTLYPIIDYELNDTIVTFDLYLDDVLYKQYNITDIITSGNITETNSTITSTEISGVEKGIRKAFLWIGVLIVSGLAGILFKKGEWTPTILKFGILIITLIEPTFGWVLAIVTLGIVLKFGIRKIIGEG